MICWSCAPRQQTLPELLQQMQGEINLEPQEDALRKAELEKWLDAILGRADLQWTAESKKLILQGISRYQLYHFMLPDSESLQKLDKYYLVWDQFKSETQGSGWQEEQSLRDLLKITTYRSEHATENWQKLLQFWQQNPSELQALLANLQQPFEIGGVVYTEPQVRLDFIEDKQNLENLQYITEFENNDFRHIFKLEERFIQRLLLFQVQADPSTELYVRVVVRAVKEKFALIRALSQKEKLTLEEEEILQKAKKKLYFLGLKKKLIRHTYYLDKSLYIRDPRIGFFFHSHPYDPKIPYLKRPSKQDQVTTFRFGPSLVFDVQETWCDVYCIIFGEVQKVYRFEQSEFSTSN